MGDLLRVDLTSRTSRQETLPPELLRDYVGGKGVGTHLLLQEIAPEVDPLSPGNKLIFVIGPMAGTSMLGGNRYAVYFASPQTGGYGECYSGGNLTPQFAKTGFKVVIVEGKAAGRVYLEISEQGVEFHDATDLWGLDAYVTEDKILERTAHPKAQACVIGPAGENLVRFACVNNNYWHQLGRGGPGAVFGSKNLKGIVWHGEKKPEVARPEAYKAVCKDLAERTKGDPGVAAYQRGGTLNMVRLMNGANAFPTRYWRKGTFDGWESLSVETMLEKHGTRNEVCPPCVMKCVKHNFVFEGRHKGLEIEGPEYETAYVFGGLCEIGDFSEVMWLNDICDRLGVDTMSAGNLAALAIEASRRGLIDEKMEFGDADCVGEFLVKMCTREGIGDLFADGIMAVEKKLGLEGVAVHVKGMEPAGYDPRVLKGMGLGFVTTPRGACHLRGTFYKAELAGFIDPAITDGKAEMYIDWEDRLCVMDMLIYCRFYRDLVQWPYIVQVVNAAVGTDYSIEDLHAVAGRVIGESHRFNELRGFGSERERLPHWVTETPMDDEGARVVTQAEMEGMRRDYYALRGWPAPAA